MLFMRNGFLILGMFLLFSAPLVAEEVSHLPENSEQKKLAYLVSDLRIPFWDIMWRGVKFEGERLGYKVDVYSSENIAKKEIELTVKALKSGIDGLVVSPTNSSACATILRLAKEAGVPVVISDIGTDNGSYVAYISSDNWHGAYKLGEILVKKMQQLGWQDGTVGIIAIPQKRANGQERTSGFMEALEDAGIKGAGLLQQVTFSTQETYHFTKKLIQTSPNMKALWLQGSDRYQAALDAIKDTGKENQILLLTFDAEPEFMQLIPKGVLLAAGMQQPYLMGEKAVAAMHAHLEGELVPLEQKLPVLAVSAENIEEKQQRIERNVLGHVKP